MAWQSGKQRHSQTSNSSQQQHDDEEDPEEDSPSAKDRRRRGRRALFEVLPLLQELDGIQRRISHGRRTRVAMLFFGVLFLIGTWRYLSSSSGGVLLQESSKPAKGEKASNLNKMDMPMRTVAGVRQGMSAILVLFFMG